MIFIFDLDHTLLNAEKLKLSLSQIFKFSRQEYDLSYHQLFGKYSDLYNPYIHLDLLVSSGVITHQQKNFRARQIKKTTLTANLFIFPEAEIILKHLHHPGNLIILVTHGDKKWQKEKIKNLKIKKYFDKIIITDKDKGDILQFLLKRKDEILIINDNERENRKLLKALPHSQAILIKGIHSDSNKNNKALSFKKAVKILLNKY